MKDKNKLIFGLVFAAIVVGLSLWAYFGRSKNGIISFETTTPEASPTVSVSPSPSGNPADESPTPEDIEKIVTGNGLIQSPVPYSELTKPATCQVGGTLKFSSPNSYQNIGAKISYTGIDNPARQIKWKISPTGDNLDIGPNLLAQLKLPDGESPVTAVLPSLPHFKDYTLTASVTYGRLIDGGIIVYEEPCSGQVNVELDY